MFCCTPAISKTVFLQKHTRGASSEKTVLTDTNLKESGYIAELVNDTQ